MRSNRAVSLKRNELERSKLAWEIVIQMNLLQSHMLETVGKENHVLRVAEVMKNEVREGREAIQESEQLCEIANRILAEASQRVALLNQKMMNMEKWTDTMERLEKQAKRLSINAAAGCREIAKEAEKLSRQVEKMAVQIDEVIVDVQFEAKTVSSLMESGWEKSIDSLSMMKRSKSVYKEIEEKVNEAADGMQDLHEKNKKIAGVVNEMACDHEAIEKLKGMIEQFVF